MIWIYMIFVFRLISTVYTVYENHVIFFLYNSLSEHFSFGSRDHYHTTAGVKLFISRKSNVTFNKKKRSLLQSVSRWKLQHQMKLKGY